MIAMIESIAETRGEYYQTVDPHGLWISLISITVVFSVLLTIAIFFTLTGRYFQRKTQGKVQKAKSPIKSESPEDTKIKAIATVIALYLRDRYDETQGKLTILRNPNRHWKNSVRNNS